MNANIKRNKFLIYFFMIPIFLLFFEVTALFIHGFWGYEDAGFINTFAGNFEKAFLAGLFFALFISLFYILGKGLPRLTEMTLKCIEIAILTIAVFLQFYFLFYIKSYYKWDSGYVISAAASLVEQGALAPEAYHYVSVYPNQNTFVCITALLIKISDLFGISVENRPVFYNVFNTVLMDAAIALIIPTFIKLRKKRTEEWEICRLLIFLFLNPFWYLGTTYYYTITLSLPFTMGFLYLYLDFLNGKGKWKGAVIAGLLLGIGYDIRPTAIVFAVATLIAFLFKAFAQKDFSWKRTSAGVALLFAVAIFAGSVLSGVQKQYIGIDTSDSAYPTVHWLMMSASFPGGHNIEDEVFTDSFATHDEKAAADTQRLKEKLKAMGVGGFMHLAASKVDRTFGDGENGYIQFLSDGYGTGAIFDWLFGGHRDLCVLYHQGYYLFMMFGIVLCVIRALLLAKAQSVNYGEYTLLLALFGAFLFYVGWESSPQYSIPFMGLMTMLACSGADAFKLSKENDGAVEKRLYQLSQVVFLVFVIAVVVLVASYGLLRYQTYTKSMIHCSRMSADQLMETEKLEVTYGEPLLQPVSLSKPFNQLVFQWRNNFENDNDALYTVKILEDKNAIWSETIDASVSPYHGVGMYTFPTIVPDKSKEYAICIEKTAGANDCNLEFLVYDMYGYNPYPGGAVMSEELLDRNVALMFALTYEYDANYMSMLQYIFIFIILECIPVLCLGYVWVYGPRKGQFACK